MGRKTTTTVPYEMAIYSENENKVLKSNPRRAVKKKQCKFEPFHPVNKMQLLSLNPPSNHAKFGSYHPMQFAAHIRNWYCKREYSCRWRKSRKRRKKVSNLSHYSRIKDNERRDEKRNPPHIVDLYNIQNPNYLAWSWCCLKWLVEGWPCLLWRGSCSLELFAPELSV